MSYINLRGWIKSKLETITDIQVFDYPTNNNGQYPYIVIEAAPVSGEYYTNRQVKRVYTFNIHLYVSLAENVRGPEAGENLFLTSLDSIITLFDNPENWHSNSNSDMVRIANIQPENEAEAGGYVRHAQIVLNITKLSA